MLIYRKSKLWFNLISGLIYANLCDTLHSSHFLKVYFGRIKSYTRRNYQSSYMERSCWDTGNKMHENRRRRKVGQMSDQPSLNWNECARKAKYEDSDRTGYRIIRPSLWVSEGWLISSEFIMTQFCPGGLYPFFFLSILSCSLVTEFDVPLELPRDLFYCFKNIAAITHASIYCISVFRAFCHITKRSQKSFSISVHSYLGAGCACVTAASFHYFSCFKPV